MYSRSEDSSKVCVLVIKPSGGTDKYKVLDKDGFVWYNVLSDAGCTIPITLDEYIELVNIINRLIQQEEHRKAMEAL